MNVSLPTKNLCFITGEDEQVRIGGRDSFPILNNLPDNYQIGVIGWGSQGPAQAQNFRDSLKSVNSSAKVTVGLRCGSESIKKAKDAGFNSEHGTLGEMYKVIKSSDLVILLISDAAQTANYKEIFAAMKPGSTLGLSHGFLRGYLDSIGETFPGHINVVMMAPKGMGPSLRRLYLQGNETGGSGINSSIAVEQDVTGSAEQIAVLWALAVGSPVIFNTNLVKEMCSDLTGERGVLLGGLWGLLEVLYDVNIRRHYSRQDSFIHSVQALTSFISPEISKLGMLGFYDIYVKGKHEQYFNSGYCSTYEPFNLMMEKIYHEVSSGNEIRDVIRCTNALSETPMESVEAAQMWQVGALVREKGDPIWELNKISAFTAGAFIGATMAQMKLLINKGHCSSEVVNESLIEGTDSLIPYMDAKGVAYMVDNCSITARLGTRKWGPQFKRVLSKSFSGPITGFDRKLYIPTKSFLDEPIHGDIGVCYGLKPKVSIVAA